MIIAIVAIKTETQNNSLKIGRIAFSIHYQVFQIISAAQTFQKFSKPPKGRLPLKRLQMRYFYLYIDIIMNIFMRLTSTVPPFSKFLISAVF